jgi:hypothetical protein
VSSKIDRKGASDPILPHPKRWNLRFFVDRAAQEKPLKFLRYRANSRYGCLGLKGHSV